MAQTPEATPEVLTSPRKAGPTSQTRAAHTKRLEQTKAYLQAQPKERVTIRKDDGNQWVQINGFAYSILATGEPVEVPRDVATALRRKGVA